MLIFFRRLLRVSRARFIMHVRPLSWSCPTSDFGPAIRNPPRILSSPWLKWPRGEIAGTTRSAPKRRRPLSSRRGGGCTARRRRRSKQSVDEALLIPDCGHLRRPHAGFSVHIRELPVFNRLGDPALRKRLRLRAAGAGKVSQQRRRFCSLRCLWSLFRARRVPWSLRSRGAQGRERERAIVRPIFPPVR